MNLPNYFLADLPPEASLSAAMLEEACRTLKSNRERFLAHHSTQGLIALLGAVAQRWLEPDFPLRQLALELGPVALGFSRPTLARGLDSFFRQMKPENLEALLEQDLGHPRRLDQMAASGPERATHRAAMATTPEFLVHLVAGNPPSAALLSMMFGVLLRSAQFVKCAPGTALLPRLFAHSLYQEEPKLGACLEVAQWRGGSADLETVLLAQADCVAATGTDEALASIRQRLTARTRFLGYSHRVSFAFVADGAPPGLDVRQVAARAAADVAAWNQLGGLSPHVIYVQETREARSERFAELLAEELARLEETEPRGELSVGEAAAITSRRSFYQLRAAHSSDTRLWCSANTTAWTVVYEADPRFQASCLHRFIYVKGVRDLTEALNHAESVRGKDSTVGLACGEDEAKPLAMELARWGVARVCPLGRMQEPSLACRLGGRPALGDLVTWTDWERTGEL